MRKITVELNAEQLKKKLNLKNGVDGLPGKDGKDAVVDTSSIVIEASTMAQEAIKPLIPTIPQLIEQMPVMGEKYRDGLELLEGEERLDAKAIKGLEKFIKEGKTVEYNKALGLYQLVDVNVTGIQSGQILRWNGSQWVASTDNDSQNLQQVTDNGSTTTNTITVPAVQINTSVTPQASAPGLIQWNQTDGTYDMGLLNSSVLQVGQETMFYGKASGAIANGDLCQFAGVQGDHILMKKAVGSEIEANPHFLIGVATENIANGVFGYVTWFGKVNGVYTKTPANQDSVDWVAGDILYFNVTTGQMTKVMPNVPNRIITVAAVIKAQTGASENGIIIVRPMVGKKLSELDDVNGTPMTTDGQILTWHNTSKYWDSDKNINDYLTSSTAGTTYVPYTGATSDVNLGTHNLTLAGYLDIGISGTDAIVLGDVSGNARGTQAIDIQAYRSAVDRVASGATSLVIGWDNKASGGRGIAVGYFNTTSGSNRSTAFGSDNIVSGTHGQAFGYANTVDGTFTSVFGISNTGSGSNSCAAGYNSRTGNNSGAMAFGYTAVATGTNSCCFGWDSVASAENGFTVGKSIANFQKDTFKLGNDLSAMSFNASGFSINNENPLSAFHATGKTLVTDVTSLGSELVTNGGFTGSTTGWTLGTGWGSETTYAKKQEDGVGTLSQPLTIVVGKYYYLTFGLASLSVGSMTVSVGGVTSPILYADTGTPTKTWKGVFKATTTDGIVFTPLSTATRIGIIDDVSVKEITSGDIEALGNISSRGLTMGYVAKTATYTVTASDHTIDCTANTFTVTLPTAVGITGRIYNIKNSGTGIITVACAGAETIDGITTQTLYQWDSIQLQSTGAGFIII